MNPRYPHPPDASSPPSLHIRARRLAARVASTPFHSDVDETAIPQRILIMRPDHLGDLLFLGPAMRWLRAMLPTSHITLVIGPWGRPALPGLAGTYDELLEIPFPGFEREIRAGLSERWRLLPAWARRLREQSYDTALIMRPDHWWGAMLAAMSGIPRRLGYKTAETTPWLSQALVLPEEHAVASNLRLAGALLQKSIAYDAQEHPLAFQLHEDDIDESQQILATILADPERPLVILHPGAGAAVKMWETSKWGSVVARLSDHGVNVVISGGPDETLVVDGVLQASAGQAYDLSGRTSFGTLAALLAEGDLALGPDNGPMNLATAIQTPTVRLYGPADPVRFGPWGPPNAHIVLTSDWSCIPCGKFDWTDLPAHGCVRDISEDDVFNAAWQLLVRQSRQPNED